MAERRPTPSAGDRGQHRATITGLAAVTAYGRGADALLDGVLTGRAAFGPVSRFDVTGRRSGVAATLPESPALLAELVGVVDQACDQAGLSPAERSATPLLLAIHGDPAIARAPAAHYGEHLAGSVAVAVAHRCGLASTTRTYVTACVAASTAVADGAAMIAHNKIDRVIVAAGYLVDADQFALFDAGRALAADGAVRPFSVGRTGLLLGDGVGAVVLESAATASDRGATALAHVDGWGRAGDAYHVVQPRPDGAGMARAITMALRRAAITGDDIGYLNAHGSGSAQSDAAEAKAIAVAFGSAASTVPISSTKSLHGQSLEASPLIEIITTVLAMRRGVFPVNAGFLGPDEACPLNLILNAPLAATPRYVLSLNAAFGGANTALVLGSV